MSIVPTFPRTLLCILGVTMVTCGVPQQKLHPRGTDGKSDDWGVVFPSVSLRDWSIQMMSAANGKAESPREAWIFGPQGPQARLASPARWSSGEDGMGKRSLVADDAAFREKSKLLTSMERQKWLNSYMQKLLVVKSS